MEKMKEIWIVWLDGGEDEYYSSQAKAHKRCIDLIFDMVEDRYLIVDYLKELEDYQCVSGFCGYCSDTIDPYDEWEEPTEDKLIEDNDTNWFDDNEKEDESEWEDDVNGDDEECNKSDLSHLYRDDTSPRNFYFHIYNEESRDYPLTVNGRALEFDTFSSAVRFLDSVEKNTDFDISSAVVKEDYLYYDGLYINATNCIINENGELTEIGERQNG